jgi:hypothetical protein
MNDVIQIASFVDGSGSRILELGAPVVRTDTVNVVFTTAEETLAAVRVAAAIGKALAVPLTLIHFRAVPYSLSLDAPAGVSPVEPDAFVERVRSEGIDVRVRVYLCRREERVLPMAFKRHSFIVIGGRRSWWPTASERLRRRLEAAGHFVVFVETFGQKESSLA